jgi:hypothetical protein
MPVSDRGVATDLTGTWVVLRWTVGTTYSLGGGFLLTNRINGVFGNELGALKEGLLYFNRQLM